MHNRKKAYRVTQDWNPLLFSVLASNLEITKVIMSENTDRWLLSRPGNEEFVMNLNEGAYAIKIIIVN
jgi:hypothetical protein